MNDLQQCRILFIGGGNMAQALIGGLLAQGLTTSQLMVADPSSAVQQYFAEKQIAIVEAESAIEQADVVVIAVKPQILNTVLQPLSAKFHQQLVISVVAGAEIATLTSLLAHRQIVRVMPNTPALRQQGASGLYAHHDVTEQQRALASQIMQATGITVWVEQEKQIDAVTAVSGSGPAYFFYMMQAMIEAGTQLGLDVDTATRLTIQTALGAAEMAKHSEYDVAELRRRVTSPNGTTEAAINSFEQQQMATHIALAMQKAYQRSGELAQALRNDVV